MKEIDKAYNFKDYTENLNELVELIVEGGPSKDELLLLGVLVQMDETLQLLKGSIDSTVQDAITQTYLEIDDYLEHKRLDI